jgi:PAS domain S-box-containing protein
VVHYAGAVLQLPEGECIGTLCVIDRRPGRLSEAQRAQLQTLAAAVVETLLLREHQDAQLRARAAHFRALSDASPIGVFHTDANGSCTYTNAAWQRIYGMSAEDALGEGWSRHLHPDDRAEVYVAWVADAAAGRPFDQHFRVRHADGKVRHVHARAQTLLDEHGAVGGHVGAVEDVTDRVEAERLFRQMADASPIGVFRCRTDGFTTYVNAAWERIHGVAAAQGLGWGWLQGLHAEDAAAAARRWREAVAASADYEASNRVVRPAGEVRHVQALARPMRDAAGAVTGYVGVVIDRTEATQAEQERSSAEALLRHAADLAGVGAWRYEIGPPARLVWSDQTARIHERPPGWQPDFDEAFAYYPLEARAPLQQAFERAVEAGTRFELELPMHTASGRPIWVQALGEGVAENGRVVRVLGAFRDVTRQRERETLLQRLYEETPALLLSFDARARVLAASRALLELMGSPRERLLGSRLEDWFASGSRAEMERIALPRLWSEGRLERQVCALQPAHGPALPMRLWATRQEDGSALALLQDLSEATRRTAELRAEQVLRRQVEMQMHELEGLLTERGEMLGVLAHEVRQPLNNASAALQAALAQWPAGDAQAEAIRRAQRVLGQVQAGVDNTLAAAELLGGRGEPSLVDVELDLLVGIALGDLPADARERVQLERLTATRTARADLSLFRLALRNLLFNALAWSPAGAPVLLRLLDREEPPALCVDVIDRGPGIAQELLDRLFERGAQANPPGRRGHGLGLYIARAAMEKQGGRAELLHTGPEGTAMRLVLAL